MRPVCHRRPLTPPVLLLLLALISTVSGQDGQVEANCDSLGDMYAQIDKDLEPWRASGVADEHQFVMRATCLGELLPHLTEEKVGELSHYYTCIIIQQGEVSAQPRKGWGF